MTRRNRPGGPAAGLTAALALALAATCLWAGRPGVVTTVDEQRYEGDVTERNDDVVVRTHGVDTVLPRSRVVGIDYTSYADRFRDGLAKLATDDVRGRVSLAREAFDRRDYPLAQAALAAALEINPLDREARELESLLSTQLVLEGRAARSRPATAPADDGEVDAAAPRPPRRRERGLDEAQANRVRQLELQRRDASRIQFRDNVRKRFVDSLVNVDYGRFTRQHPVDQALSIFAEGAPEMVDDVIVRDNPASLDTFGRRVHVAVVQGCASSQCHGGTAAGRFRLLSGTPDPSTMITNFYLLTQYAQQFEPEPNDVFATGSVAMIDRGNARASLLYQYALPRARARLKHPAVRGWDGLFRDDGDRVAREMIAWMESDLARLQPDYGFDFALADDATTRPGATTRPATTRPSTARSSPVRSSTAAAASSPATRPERP